MVKGNNGEEKRLWKGERERGENIQRDYTWSVNTQKGLKQDSFTMAKNLSVNLVGIDAKGFKSLEYELYTFDTVLRVNDRQERWCE